ncbi:unnamed protein product, partial [Ectocarpus fasciculatus]
NIPPLQDYNLQADLLMLPTTKKGYKYLLTMVDLWSDEIDARPLKTKVPDDVLKAMKNIFKGKHIQRPKATLRTDGGTEFKGVFHKYLYDNGVYHSVALPYRHKQMGNIENVNKLLGRFLNTYMNTKNTHEWTDLLPDLIDDLNKVRKRPDQDPYTHKYPIAENIKSKYNIGDLVYRKLDRPIDENNNNLHGSFRTGDLRFDIFQPREIKHILYYPNNIRYVLKGFEKASYTEAELMSAEDDDENKFNVREIWDKRKVKNDTQYRVWFKGELKKESLWLSKSELIKDGFEDEIKEFD